MRSTVTLDSRKDNSSLSPSVSRLKACQAFTKHKLVAADKKAAPGTTFTVHHEQKEKSPSIMVEFSGLYADRCVGRYVECRYVGS